MLFWVYLYCFGCCNDNITNLGILMYVPCILYIIQSNKCTKHTHTHTHTHTYIYIYVYIYLFIYLYSVYRKYSYMFRCICIVLKESYSSPLLKLQKLLRLQTQ